MPAYDILRTHKVERISIVPRLHPYDGSTSYLCQFAVDGVPCARFWSHFAERQSLGEDSWYEMLKQKAVEMYQEHGPQPAFY
jgi:hypothetical protein